jgi:hypothetical protein
VGDFEQERVDEAAERHCAMQYPMGKSGLFHGKTDGAGPVIREEGDPVPRPQISGATDDPYIGIAVPSV